MNTDQRLAWLLGELESIYLERLEDADAVQGVIYGKPDHRAELVDKKYRRVLQEAFGLRQDAIAPFPMG